MLSKLTTTALTETLILSTMCCWDTGASSVTDWFDIGAVQSNRGNHSHLQPSDSSAPPSEILITAPVNVLIHSDSLQSFYPTSSCNILVHMLNSSVNIWNILVNTCNTLVNICNSKVYIYAILQSTYAIFQLIYALLTYIYMHF